MQKANIDGGPFSTLPSYDLSNRKLTVAEKSWMANLIVDGKETASTIGKQFNLKRKAITYWSKRVREGHVLHDSSGGRPACLDEVAEKDMIESVAIKEENPRGISPTDFKNCVTKGATTTSGKKNTIIVKPLCNKTIAKYMKIIGAKFTEDMES